MKQQVKTKSSNSIPDETVRPSSGSFNLSWNLMRFMVYFFGIVALLVVVLTWINTTQISQYALNNAYVVTEVGTFQATNSTVEPNSRKIEVINHVRSFLNLMYSYDERTFKGNVESALHLIGTDGKLILQGYTENRVLEDLIKTSGSVSVSIDSIKTDMSRHPYYAVVYAKQRFQTPAGQQYYRLDCAMQLRDVSRSARNIHGLLIENFTLQDNSPLE